jgi:hypothetical protein
LGLWNGAVKAGGQCWEGHRGGANKGKAFHFRSPV